jgi:hypothetical protein
VKAALLQHAQALRGLWRELKRVGPGAKGSASYLDIACSSIGLAIKGLPRGLASAAPALPATPSKPTSTLREAVAAALPPPPAVRGGGPGRPQVCGKCKQSGHNGRTCRAGASAPPAPEAPVHSGATEAPAADADEEGEPVVPQPAVALARQRATTTASGKVRSLSIAPRRLTAAELAEAERDPYPSDVQRPRTRGECQGGPRPCPFVSCRHHLYLDVLPSGSLKLNRPELDVWDLEQSCALDVADKGGGTLEEVGQICGITRERVRQVEERALLRIKLRKDADLGLMPERAA